jgi:hypothetical protein
MTITVNGQKMEPIKTAPKTGCPVWAQIADLPTAESLLAGGIEPAELHLHRRTARRAWIYWSDEGLPGCNPNGHWVIVGPDFEYHTYNFFIDGWFPWFTPNLHGPS